MINYPKRDMTRVARNVSQENLSEKSKVETAKPDSLSPEFTVKGGKKFMVVTINGTKTYFAGADTTWVKVISIL